MNEASPPCVRTYDFNLKWSKHRCHPLLIIYQHVTFYLYTQSLYKWTTKCPKDVHNI